MGRGFDLQIAEYLSIRTSSIFVLKANFPPPLGLPILSLEFLQNPVQLIQHFYKQIHTFFEPSMADIARPLTSVNRVEKGSFPARTAEYPRHSAFAQVSPPQIVEEWLQKFNSTLNSDMTNKLTDLFMTESYWRDQLCLSWTFRTLEGPEKISSFFDNLKSKPHVQSVTVDESAPYKTPTKTTLDYLGKVPCVQAWLKFKTDVGNGVGIVRLVQDTDDGNHWKAFTLFTTLRELNGYEETIGSRRLKGVNHGGLQGRLNWQDRRNTAQEVLEDPVVLIVGAGQSGLTLAARLKQLGIETLLIDTNERIGDSWRKRYHQLVLHDPVWYDHLPYMEFPPNWPVSRMFPDRLAVPQLNCIQVFTPKDKLADWFESYVKSMELVAWTSTQLKSSKYVDETGKWTVVLERTENGKTTTST